MDTLIKKTDIVADAMRRKILTGRWASGMKLPQGLELAQRYQVSHNTIRAVCRKLEEEGLLAVIQGRGMFVAAPERKDTENSKVLAVSYSSNLEQPGNYILPAFEQCCYEAGVSVVRAVSDFLCVGPREHVLGILRKENYSGVLLANSFFSRNAPEVQLLQQLGVPVLIPHAACSDAEETGFMALRVDFAAAWREGIKFLTAHGHRRIGLVVASEKNSRGYSRDMQLKLLEKCGAAGDPELLAIAAYNLSEVAEAVKKLMALPLAPTAIFCYSDFYAIHVYYALERLGYRIPDDVSVLGYCGYPGGIYMNPPLTTLDFDYNGIGRTAAGILLGDSPYRPGEAILTPHSLKERGSVRKL